MGIPLKARCRCGKIAWPTEQDALNVLVHLKIKNALRGRKKRQETRAYHCDVAPGWWHLTSLPEWSDLRTRSDVEESEQGHRRERAITELLEMAEQQAEEIDRLKDRLVSVAKSRDDLEATLALIRNAPDDAVVPYESPRQQYAYGIPRMTSTAISCFPMGAVSRPTVRALLPVGITARKGNNVTFKFAASLKTFDDRNWITRRDLWIDIHDYQALATHSTTGVVRDPRMVLDVDRAVTLVENQQPHGDQRDRELAALYALQGVIRDGQQLDYIEDPEVPDPTHHEEPTDHARA